MVGTTSSLAGDSEHGRDMPKNPGFVAPLGCFDFASASASEGRCFAQDDTALGLGREHGLKSSAAGEF
jgi:hypothetical protein